jgi:hypothetical protein
LAFATRITWLVKASIQKLDPRFDRLDRCDALVPDHDKEEEALGGPGLYDAIVVNEHAPWDGAEPNVGICYRGGMPSWSGEH